jgi:hypothetical protein
MGTFLAVSIIGGSLEETKQKLIEFSEKSQGSIESLKIDDDNILYSQIKQIDNNHTAVLYPLYNSDFYFCAHFISENLDTSVLTIYIHDDDAWFFILYDKGYEITRYTSNSMMIESNPESWICNYQNVSLFYNIDEKKVQGVLEKNSLNGERNECFNQVTDFMRLLQLPTKNVFDFKNYMPIIEQDILDTIKKPFISLLDLRKTKKYSNQPIELNKGEFLELFGDDSWIIKKTEENIKNASYFLNIESLTLQIFENHFEENKSTLIHNIAFTHKMEDIQDFLNQ